MRRDIPLEDAPVLEAQHVEPLGSRVPAVARARQRSPVAVLELFASRAETRLDAAALELVRR